MIIFSIRTIPLQYLLSSIIFIILIIISIFNGDRLDIRFSRGTYTLEKSIELFNHHSSTLSIQDIYTTGSIFIIIIIYNYYLHYYYHYHHHPCLRSLSIHYYLSIYIILSSSIILYHFYQIITMRHHHHHRY